MLTRRDALRALAASAAVLATGRRTLSADSLPAVIVHKDPGCGCCDKWADHMRAAGFTVEVREEPDRVALKQRLGIPEGWQTCHTGIVEGYVVDGHVPADLVQRMLKDKATIRGLGVPGMPVGSPGMEVGTRRESYQVLSFTKDGATAVYAQR